MAPHRRRCPSPLKLRPLHRAAADCKPTPEERAINRVFEEAFGSCLLASSESAVDSVLLTPQGMQLTYSWATAEWLARVAEQPHDCAY